MTGASADHVASPSISKRCCGRSSRSSAMQRFSVGFTNTAWVMEGWMGSARHCSNIMNPEHTDVGMGRAGNYWTQDFARRL